MSTTIAVRERPILFSGPMIRALLEGRKTVTRRVVKPQPIVRPDQFPTDEEPKCVLGVETRPGVLRCLGHDNFVRELCPYGQPGDRLVVKEAAWMWCERRPNGTTPTGRPKWLYVPLRSAPVHYAADLPAGARPAGRVVSPDTGNEWGWRLKVARFLPRWASRITLEITEVRVERLQEISREDAIAEGVWSAVERDRSIQDRAARVGIAEGRREVGPVDYFRALWDSLNAERGYGWDSSPWVWVVRFRRVAPQGAEGGEG